SSERLCVKFAVERPRLRRRPTPGAERLHFYRYELAALREQQRIASRHLHRRLFQPARHAVMDKTNAAFRDEPRRRSPRLHETRAKKPDIDALPLAQDGPPRRRRGGALVGGKRLASAENALSVGALALPLRRGPARRQRFGAPSSPGA